MIGGGAPLNSFSGPISCDPKTVVATRGSGMAPALKHGPLRLNGDGSARIGFLLMPEFPLYALMPAMEAVRIANQLRLRRYFDWQLISEDGQPVKACNGLSLSVDASLAQCTSIPNLLVFGCNHPLQHVSRKILNWLRRLA